MVVRPKFSFALWATSVDALALHNALQSARGNHTGASAKVKHKPDNVIKEWTIDECVSKPPMPEVLDPEKDCAGVGLKDPFKFIPHFLKEGYDKSVFNTGDVQMIMRPGGLMTRPLMCLGLVVGRSIDTKAHRSFLSPGPDELVRENSPGNLISFCQACGIVEPKDDMWVKGDSMHIWDPEWTEPPPGYKPFCATYNQEVEGKCRITGYSSLDQLQHYHQQALFRANEFVPLGVEKRVCVKMQVMHDYERKWPFMGYKSTSGHTGVLANDFDPLAVAECPAGPSSTLRYPMYATDSDEYYYEYGRFIDKALALASLVKHTSKQEEEGYGGHAVRDPDFLQALARFSSVSDNLHLGYAPPHVKKFLMRMIQQSAVTGSGAVRHMPESENVYWPQKFYSGVYPVFDKNGELPTEDGIAGVIAQYEKWFDSGCCVHMNPIWLTYRYHRHGYKKAAWINVWQKGIAAAESGNLRGCPFWDRTFSKGSSIFVDTMAKWVKRLNATYFKNTTWAEDDDGVNDPSSTSGSTTDHD